jgi:Flp pilus assembly protein TadG
MLMPLFFFLAFALLQIGHLGVAIALVHYGASSAARAAVHANSFTESDAPSRFKKLLGLGLKSGTIEGRVENNVAPNITVTACAELRAYPFVGAVLKKTSMGKTSEGCSEGGIGPVSLKGNGPFHFVIRAQAVARMNYGGRS